MNGRNLFRRAVLIAAFALPAWGSALADDPEANQRYYHNTIKPVLAKHCHSCHNEADRKGGLNLEDVFFVTSIIRSGARWSKLTEMIASGEMPPDTKPRLTPEEKQLVIEGINGFLTEALADPDPGLVVMRRLSQREYRYSVLDLLGIDFDLKDFFPTDGSGGQGFDNHARVLYVTALSIERYYEAAEMIVGQLYDDPAQWRNIVPRSYRRGLGEQIAIWWHRFRHGEDISLRGPVRAAEHILYPIAAKAYRRFPQPADRAQITDIFSRVYTTLDRAPDRFDRSIRESLKVILVSPHFLYRHEVDLPLERPYPLNGFEVASRLAYFLWSSLPDEELLNLAYRGELHEPEVLKQQAHRMLADPRSRRFSESFATQWLGVSTILDAHEVDPETFPEVTPDLRRAMYEEVVSFFHHVLTERETFRDLLDSKYAFVNADLAAHYGISGVTGDDVAKVDLSDHRRGGVLGMGGVLMATSLPTRTSPVLRGKWVLEQILGTPPAPPPPDVPELETAREVKDEMDLRQLLALHASSPECHSCHAKMDPLGFALENFDAVGRWRDGYGDRLIDASGVLVDGTVFDGPIELKQALLERQELFAKNLTDKMLAFALGRDVRFQDKIVVEHLTKHLIENDFHTVSFITEIVTSFPFLYKKSDPPKT